MSLSIVLFTGLFESYVAGHRSDGVVECIVSVGNAIFFAGECTPAVDAAESHLLQVDAEFSEVLRLHFGEVGVGLMLASVDRLD